MISFKYNWFSPGYSIHVIISHNRPGPFLLSIKLTYSYNSQIMPAHLNNFELLSYQDALLRHLHIWDHESKVELSPSLRDDIFFVLCDASNVVVVSILHTSRVLWVSTRPFELLCLWSTGNFVKITPFNFTTHWSVRHPEIAI